jgi:hypothetical protein
VMLRASFALRVAWNLGTLRGVFAWLASWLPRGGVEISAFFSLVHYPLVVGFLSLRGLFGAVVGRF